MTSAAPREITSAHSPDSDDAFMFYGLATKKVRSSKVTFRHVLSDIETLNRKAMEGFYDLSAISYHAYPYVADKYVLMASGSSIGDGYGPMIISSRPMEPDELKGKRIAVPGTLTTAYLTCRLFQPDFEAVVTPFDKITDAVRDRSVDGGLV
ncbi:MAG TPA: MqnA/MqnD/SBP family protein, partial [Bryobacteraceae bacterium]|nr:MqnA/MqnD/SBP family protein [Bryobacteraceae bacterium]